MFISCLLAVAYPLHAEPLRQIDLAPQSPPSPDHGPINGPISGTLDTKERLSIAAIALSIALLRLLKDFRQYSGLLYVLLWNGYAWGFLGLVATFIFFVDVQVWPLVIRMFGEALNTHISLILGHFAVTGAFAYVSPSLLAKIPLLQDKARPKEETTEMFFMFGSIRQSLAGRANDKLCKWTAEYDWEVLRFAAHMLILDQVATRMLSEEQGQALTVEMDAIQGSDVPLRDREKKYQLMCKMMRLTSFADLRLRLRQAAEKQ